MPDNVTATIQFIKFPRSAFTGSSFVILSVREKDSARATTVKGEIMWEDLQDYYQSDPRKEVIFTGKWEEHPKWGKQLKFEGYHEFNAISAGEINSTALSKFFIDNISGLGAVGASNIMLDAPVDELVRILEEDPKQLIGLHSKIDQKVALHLSTTWNNERALMRCISFFADFQITGVFPRKIFEEFGESAVETVKDNPYILIDKIENIGWKRADEIAIKMGIAHSAPVRMSAALLHSLKQMCLQAGHCFMDRESLVKAAKKLIKVAGYRIDVVLGELLEAGEKVIQEEDRIYLPQFLYVEQKVEEYVKRMIS